MLGLDYIKIFINLFRGGVVIIFHIRPYHLLYRILGSECYHFFYNNHTLMIVTIHVIFL